MRAGWIAGWLLIAGTAAANDTLATLGAGGLVPVKSSQIAMEREDLEISVHRITVRYLFRNLSDKDVDAVVAFPLPDLEGGLVEHEPLQLPEKNKTNFVDFEVTVAGKPVATQMEVRAFHEGRDITDTLHAAGVPVSVIDAGLEAAIRKLPAQHSARAIRERRTTGIRRCLGPVKSALLGVVDNQSPVLLDAAFPRTRHNRSAAQISAP